VRGRTARRGKEGYGDWAMMTHKPLITNNLYVVASVLIVAAYLSYYLMR